MPNVTRPPQLKAITGTARPDREPAKPFVEYALVEEFPAAPQHLNPDGAEMWANLGRQFTAAKILQEVDLYLLSTLCYAWQEHEKKAKAGMEVTASERNALKALFAEFGIGPASRRSVKAVGEAKAKNRFAANGKRTA
jgi:phage terminase small subunit